MSSEPNSVVSRLINRVFPRMPDFYSLINEQCDLAVEVMSESNTTRRAGSMMKAPRGGSILKAPPTSSALGASLPVPDS